MSDNSKYVDERVVEMRIDNKKFESGAKQTISTLEKLEKALKLKSDTSALDSLEKSVGKFDASPMSSSLEKVQMSFSALEVVGMRVIQNLTDSVYGFASKTVKDLTIGQVSAGWNKYEQMIEATQTIMAATRDQVGEGLPFADEVEQMETINGLLDKLLWYTDETSYSFTDMAANVGKFLAAGTGLEDTFTAMMGIASWGATAGAKPTEVSRAMYNISQAMGSGSMMAIDWRSIENAGMATLDFKKNALIVSQEMEKLREITDDVQEGFIAAGAVEYDETGYIMNMSDEDIEKLLVTAENFRETLQSKWFDKDVMMEVFRRYGLFADLLHEKTEETGMEATELLEVLDKYRKAANDPESYSIDWQAYADDAGITVEKLQEVIAELDGLGIAYSETGFRMGQEAKTFTDAIEATKDAVSSRWMQTFKYIFGDYLQAKTFWTQATGELYEIFASSGDIRNDILAEWSKNDTFGRSGRDYLLGGWDEEINGQIVEVKGALWNLIDAIHTFTDPIKEAFAEVFGFDNTKQAGERLRELTMRFQQFTAGLGFSEEAQEGLKSIFTLIFSGAKTGVKAIGAVIKIANKVLMVIGELSDAFLSLINGNLDPNAFLERMKVSIGALIPSTDDLKKGFKSVGKTILGLIPSEQKLINIYDTIKTIAKGRWASLKNLFSADSLKGVLPTIDQLRDGLEKIKQYLATNYPLLYNWIKTLKETSVVGNVISGATKGFESLIKVFSNLKLDTSKFKETFKQFSTTVKFIFDGLFGDPKELKEKIAVFISTVWHGFLEGLQKISIRDVFAAMKLAIFASIIGELLSIVRTFKQTAKEIKSIPEAISGMFGQLGDTFKQLGQSFKANAYIKIAVAMGILTGAILLLSKVDESKLTHIVVVLGVFMFLMSKLMNSVDGLVKFNKGVDIKKFQVFSNLASALIGLGVLIAALGSVIAKIASVKDSASIWSAFGVIALLIVEIGGVVWAIAYFTKNFKFDEIGSFGKTLLRAATSMMIIALAIRMFVKPLIEISKEFGRTGSHVWKSFFVIVGLIAALSGAVGILTSLKFGDIYQVGNDMLKVAASMVIIVIAIRMLVKPLLTISKELGQSGNQIGWSFAVLFGFIASLTAAIWALSKFAIGSSKGIGKEFLSAAASMILIVVAIRLIVKPLITISDLIKSNGASILWSFGALIVIMGLLLGIMKIINKFQDGSKLLKIAAALGILAVGISVLVGVLGIFGTITMGALIMIPWELLAQRIEVFKSALLPLLGLAGIALIFGVAILAAGAGILAFGTGLLEASVAFVVFSFGLGLFSSGLSKVSAAIPTFVDSMVTLGDKLKGLGKEGWTSLAIGAAAMIAMAGAAALLAWGLSKLLSLDKVQEKLTSLGKGLVNAVSTLMSFAGKKIMENLPMIGNILVALVTITGMYLVGLIPTLTDLIGTAIITLLESIHTFIRANKGALEHSVFGIVEVILEVIADAGTWVITVLRGIINGIATGLLNWIADMVQKIPGIGEKFATKIRGFADELPGPEELMDQWNAQKVTDESFLKQFIPPEQEIIKTGKEIPDKLGIGVEEGTADLQETLGTITENFTTTFSGIPDKAQEQGQLVLPMFAEGVLSGEGEASTSISGVGERMVDIFDALPDSASTSGTNFLTGWTNGFIEKWNSGEVTSAIQKVGGQIVNTLNDATGVHSPSIYARETGQYFLEGLALGLGDEQKGVLTQVTGFGNLLVKALSGTMAQVGMIANEDLTLSPRITPVVDLTNLNQASGIIDHAFGKSYGVSTSVGQAVNRRMSEMEDIAANMQASSETTYSNDQFTFNIYATEGMNENDIANAVMQKMRQQFAQRKVAFG